MERLKKVFKSGDEVICVDDDCSLPSQRCLVKGERYVVERYFDSLGQVSLVSFSNRVFFAWRFKPCREEITEKACVCSVRQLFDDGCVCGAITRYGF